MNAEIINMPQNDIFLNNELAFRNKLLSVLSHDTKGLLANFLWMTEAVESGMDSPELLSDLVNELKVSIEKNAALLNDTITWLKMQEKEFRINRKSFSIIDLYENLKTYFAADLINKNSELIFDGNRGTHFETDQTIITFILKFLLKTAIDCVIPEKNIIFQFVEKKEKIEIIFLFETINSDKINELKDNFREESLLTDQNNLQLKYSKDFLFLMNGALEINEKENSGIEFKLFLNNP